MQRILIIQTASIGDVILATPLVEEVHRLYPFAQIDFLLKKGNESLFDHHPFLHRVFIFDKKKNKFWQVLKLLTDIRKEQYDLIINVQRFFTSGLITILSGAKQTAGFNKNPCSVFFSIRIKHHIDSGEKLHEVERNLMLIAHLGAKKKLRPQLYLPHDFVNKLAGEREYFCIAPASLWFTKQFPEEKWIELIHQAPSGLNVILLGSRPDFMLCEKIKTSCSGKKVYNYAGQLNLLETAAVMKDAKMNFVNDSAPMHLASAVNAPVAAIFCSTVKDFGFTPLSDQSFVIETDEKLNCRPCGLHGHKECPEKHFRCSKIDVNYLLKETKLV